MNPLSAILNIGSSLIDRLIPDREKAAEAKQQLLAQAQSGEFNLMAQQLEVNKVEAASNSKFVAGWRPFIGWICGCALAVDMIIRPLLSFFSTMLGHPVNLPALEMSSLLPLLGGMLGFGIQRTVEKIQGVANGH